MPQLLLRQKLRELCNSQATLLWLEGAKHDRVLGVSLQGDRLVLQLSNGTTRVVAFDKFAITKVGLQFWSSGRPGVLYRWDQVPAASTPSGESASTDGSQKAMAPVPTGADGDEPPPDMAA